MIKSFMNYALDQGWTPRFMETETGVMRNVIQFDNDDLHFLFICNENKDPNFFQMSLPYIDDFVENDKEKLHLILALTRDYKAGKIIVSENNRVSLSFEHYAYNKYDIEKLFADAVGCLKAMFMEYRDKARAITINNLQREHN